LAGEILVTLVGISVPGPVIGMVILFLFLLARGSIPKELASVGDTLLSNLSLLFVPAGVGVMLHFQLLGEDLLAVSVALIASTVLTIIVTALAMQYLSRMSSQKVQGTDADE
jgi:putative effector of murein hydrolase LrgA (UPF0299 family)